MPRAFLCVMDSVGCGGAPDAGKFGDEGANTLGNIADACERGLANEGRQGPLQMPFLDSLGLGKAIELASGRLPRGMGLKADGLWGAATEASTGKDTPSGHWELAGAPVLWEWRYFRDSPPFSEDILSMVREASGCGSVLGNRHASGTAIVDELGEEHVRTGFPICYTSNDSVLQIAAHEEAFGLERLCSLCAALAPRMHKMKVGRVIARPFRGGGGEGFERTANRRDYAMSPPRPTLLDALSESGRHTVALGKIWDIFSGKGISEHEKGEGDDDLLDRLERQLGSAPDGALVFANFVEFDSLYGHRRDVSGYARALERFDKRASEILKRARPGDLAVFTADHGNDPTWRGSDHTRERVPVLAWGAGKGGVGLRGFADVGASVAAHLGVDFDSGRSFL